MTHQRTTTLRTLFVVGAALLSLTTHPAGVRAQEDSSSSPSLELILRENSYVVEMNGELFLGYDIIGDLEGFVALPSPFEDPDAEVDPAYEEALAQRSQFEVVVTSHAPIEDRSQVEAVLMGEPGPALDGARINFDEVVQVDELSRAVGFLYAIPTATGGNRAAELELVREGLFPISVELWRDGSRIARHFTFAERLADPSEPSIRPVPFQVSVLAGVTDPGPEPTEEDRVRVRAELAQLRDLAVALRSPFTAIIPPAAAMELVEVPEISEQLVPALRRGEIVVLPSVRLNPSSAVEAGASNAFTAAFRAGEDLLGVIVPEVPIRRTTWPASARISGPEISLGGAGLLRDLGAQLLVISPETYLGLSGALPPEILDTSVWHAAELPGGSTASLGVIDPISRILDPGRTTDHSLTELAVWAMAEISAQRYQTPSGRRVALVSSPDLGVPDAEVVSRLEEILERHPGFQFSLASRAAGSVDTYRTGQSQPGVGGMLRRVTLPERAGPDLRQRAVTLRTTRNQIEVIASMLLPTDARPNQWRDSASRWLSTAYSDAQVEIQRADLAEELAAIPASIQLPDPFTFTLTGEVSEISLRIVNTSGVPLRVVVHAEASKLTFPEAPRELTLAPGVTTVDLAVRTLSNGTFGVRVDLRTPLGNQLIGEPLQLTARVNALTGLGQVLTGGAVVVLASWWFNHLRKRRRGMNPA